jgi:DUF1680 family protein
MTVTRTGGASYLATRDGTGLQLHQYAPARLATELPSGRALGARVETRYPWEGSVRLTIEEADGSPCTLALRIPAWCERAAVRVNGRAVAQAVDPGSYVRLAREWRGGDAVELELPMEARLIEGHPAIESTRGAVAIERGPLVYCLEQADHGAIPLAELELDATASPASHWDSELLEGVVVVRVPGYRVDPGAWRGTLYRPVRSAPAPSRHPVELTAIPYYAWANRDPGAMRVWVPRATI